MHELSITENILEIAIRHAEKAQASKITNLYLVIGQLSSVIDDSIQFYWDILAKDTKAEGATLHFRRIPVVIRCHQCELEFAPESGDLTCPACGSDRINILKGEEFSLEAIDVEKENSVEDNNG
jgi:hydrogenase nickel incorporation protein HypA/HybF